MAGMLGMLVGGAAEGWSEGRLSQIKAEREERLKQMEEARQDRRLAEDRKFRSDEAAIGREAQIGENKRQEGVQSIEAQKNRDVQGTQYTTDEDGNTQMIRGGVATPVVGADKKPLREAKKASDKPADQQMVEYLMTLGKTQEEALGWVKTSRGKSDEDSKLALYRAHITAGLDEEEASAATDRAWDKYGGAAEAPAEPTDRTAPEGPDSVTKDKPGALLSPPGFGDKDDPFQATKQSHIDWFKKYAKSGQVIVIDGKAYTK